MAFKGTLFGMAGFMHFGHAAPDALDAS